MYSALFLWFERISLTQSMSKFIFCLLLFNGLNGAFFKSTYSDSLFMLLWDLELEFFPNAIGCSCWLNFMGCGFDIMRDIQAMRILGLR
jgi:hypothetical protein